MGGRPFLPNKTITFRRRVRYALAGLIQNTAVLEQAIAKAGANTFLGEFWRKMLPPPHTYPQPAYRRCRRWGLFWELDCSQWMDWCAYFLKPCKENDFVLSLVKPGDHILDCGGNIGLLALPMAQKAGKYGMVFSFEPFDVSHRKLKSHKRINRIENLKLFQAALGDTSGSLKITKTEEHNDGGARVMHAKENTYYKKVPVTTVDHWCKKNKIEKLDLIKIDCEGYEFKILKGAQKAMKQLRPTIFLESNPDHLKEQGDSVKKIRKLLKANLYKCKVIHGSCMHILAIPENTTFQKAN